MTLLTMSNFVFQEFIPFARLYGEVDDLLETIRDWGIAEAHFINTTNAEFIPKLLKLPFMVGSIGIIHGTKWGYPAKQGCDNHLKETLFQVVF